MTVTRPQEKPANLEGAVERIISLLDEMEPWRLRANCRNRGTKLFFPARGDSIKAARTICEACPVQKECADYAERSKSDYGMWGGHMRSPLDRRGI